MLAKSILNCISPVDGELDTHIAKLVITMREMGFNTISSCEGHFRPNDYKHAKPNVIFCALDRGS